MDEKAQVSCPMAGLGINSVETSSYAIRVSFSLQVMFLIQHLAWSISRLQATLKKKQIIRSVSLLARLKFGISGCIQNSKHTFCSSVIIRETHKWLQPAGSLQSVYIFMLGTIKTGFLLLVTITIRQVRHGEPLAGAFHQAKHVSILRKRRTLTLSTGQRSSSLSCRSSFILHFSIRFLRKHLNENASSPLCTKWIHFL
jgi:hypothetical protein